MSFIFLILVICCYTGTIVILSKQKFGECVPITMLSMPLIMYYTQFVFGTFKVGYYLIILIALIVFPVLFYKSKEKGECLKLYFSLGFIGFLVIVGIFCVLDFRRYFHLWDEMSHWGMMTKEILRLDSWYSEEASRLLVHKDYPPFLSLFEMLFCKLYGGYSEPRVYLGLHTFMLSLLVPPILDRGIFVYRENVKESKLYCFIKKVLWGIMISILFVLIIESFDIQRLFNTIYKDVAIAVIFAYAMLLIVNGSAIRERFYYIALLLSTIALLLTKQMGILFVLLIWFYYGINCLKSIVINKEERRTILGRVSVLVIIPMLSQYVWTTYVNGMEADAQFALSNISVNEVLNIIMNKSENVIRRQTYINYLQALFEKNIGSYIFPITYVMISFIIILVLGILIYKKTHIFDKYSMITLGITCVCGTLGYAFTMLVLYLFCYSEIEMTYLASFERYMSSYIIGEMLIMVSILLMAFSERRILTIGKIIITCALMAGWLNRENLEVFIPGILVERPNQQYTSIADRLELSTEGNAKVFIVSNSTVETQYYVNYYAEDVDIVLCYTDVLNVDTENEDMINIIKEIVFTNDYVYIQEMSEEFNACYSKLNGNKSFEIGHLYKVMEDGTVCMVE